MTIVTKSAPVMALIVFTMLAPAAAQGQDQRFRVAFTPAAATVSGDAEMAWSGSFGYRFSEHFWFEGDFTWIDAAAGGFRDRDLAAYSGLMNITDLTDALRRGSGMFGRGGLGFPNLPNLPGRPGSTLPVNASFDGSTAIGTIGIRYELPVQTTRFRPYLAGGMGLNNTDQEIRIDPRVLAIYEDSVSHSGYAFNAGAGASVRLVSQLWADVDAKYFRLSRERNIMRLGGGVSLRF